MDLAMQAKVLRAQQERVVNFGTQFVYAVKPGDAMTIRGLRARAIPMVQAMSVMNDVTGATVTDTGAGGPRPRPGEAPSDAQQTLSAMGRIEAQLHGPRGDLNRALLEVGTIVLRLGQAQLARAERELADAAAAGLDAVVFMHTCPADLQEGAERLGAVLAKPHVTCVHMGHTHYNEPAPAGGEWTASRRHADGSDADRVGAWPERGIFGIQLGPNRNKREW